PARQATSGTDRTALVPADPLPHAVPEALVRKITICGRGLFVCGTLHLLSPQVIALLPFRHKTLSRGLGLAILLTAMLVVPLAGMLVTWTLSKLKPCARVSVFPLLA